MMHRRLRLVLTLLAVLAPALATAQTYTLAPVPIQQYLDVDGNPMAGYKICTYGAGTTIPATTYLDSAGTPQTNPIILSASGRPQNGGTEVGIYLAQSSYKFVLLTPGSDTTCGTGTIVWTRDNVTAVPTSSASVDIAGTAGETLNAGNVVYLSDGSGAKTAGRWYKGDASNLYSSTAPELGIALAAIASGSSGSIRISGQVTGLSSLSVGAPYFVSGTPGSLISTAPVNRRFVGSADTTTSLVLQPWQPLTFPANTGLAQGRLTLTSGTPVTTSDVTAAATVYYTPATGNLISLFDGNASWNPRTFSELSVPLSGLVVGQAYDVFAWDSAGTVTLETAEWANATITMTIAAPGVVTWTSHGLSTGMSVTFTTSGALPTGVTANTQYFVTVVDANSFKLSTTLANVAAGTFITTSVSQSGTHTGHQPQARQTALVRQDGVYVKSGATTRRYLGTFLTTGTGTTEDSLTKRYLWNYNNRVKRVLRRLETAASWTYTLAAYQQANASTANQVEVVIGVQEVALDLHVSGTANLNTANNIGSVSIGQDSTTTSATGTVIRRVQVPSQLDVSVGADLGTFPRVGRSWFLWLEQSTAAGITTWYGTAGATNVQSGLSGSIEG